MRRRVEREQARGEERPLPPGVQAPAVQVLALALVVRAQREVEEVPVARRLVRLDARPADLRDEQAADRQRVVTHELGIQAEAPLAGEYPVERVALLELF